MRLAYAAPTTTASPAKATAPPESAAIVPVDKDCGTAEVVEEGDDGTGAVTSTEQSLEAQSPLWMLASSHTQLGQSGRYDHSVASALDRRQLRQPELPMQPNPPVRQLWLSHVANPMPVARFPSVVLKQA